jgi:hypothetical protein
MQILSNKPPTICIHSQFLSTATRKPGRLGAIDMIRQLQTPVSAPTGNSTEQRNSLNSQNILNTSYPRDEDSLSSGNTSPSKKQSFMGSLPSAPASPNRRQSAAITAIDSRTGKSVGVGGHGQIPVMLSTSGSRSNSLAIQALPDIVKSSGSSAGSPGTIRQLELERVVTSPKVTLTVESPVAEFRMFHHNIPHPATVLGLVADEDDRQVFTEFDELCNELLSTLGDFEAALEEMTLWKDDFLTQTVPANVKLQLTLLFARLFRRFLSAVYFNIAQRLIHPLKYSHSKSEMHEPLFELLKQVRLYSRPWMNKHYALLELEKDYQR